MKPLESGSSTHALLVIALGALLTGIGWTLNRTFGVPMTIRPRR